MKIKQIICPGLVAAMLLAGSACAKTVAPDRFASLDKNGDGKVVVEEFRAAFPNMNEQAFVVIDANQDGAIDQNEWSQFMDGHSQPDMRALKQRGADMNNMPGDPLIPPVDSNDLPLMRPPGMQYENQ